jgi:hypothetical protein
MTLLRNLHKESRTALASVRREGNMHKPENRRLVHAVCCIVITVTVLSIVFDRLALGLTIPAVRILAPTLFSSWFYANQSLAEGIAMARGVGRPVMDHLTETQNRGRIQQERVRTKLPANCFCIV